VIGLERQAELEAEQRKAAGLVPLPPKEVRLETRGLLASTWGCPTCGLRQRARLDRRCHGCGRQRE
jgi:hypothetical protein